MLDQGGNVKIASGPVDWLGMGLSAIGEPPQLPGHTCLDPVGPLCSGTDRGKSPSESRLYPWAKEFLRNRVSHSDSVLCTR